MNEPELENELRALKPAAPSRSLESRIAASLDEPAAAPRRARVAPWWRWFGERLLWAGIGATCAWTLAVRGVEKPAQKPAADEVADAQPVTTEEPLAVRDEGVRFSDDGAPVRLVRYTMLERRMLEDGVEVTLPREDVMLLPVAMQ